MEENIQISKEDFEDFILSLNEKIKIKKEEVHKLEIRYNKYLGINSNKPVANISNSTLRESDETNASLNEKPILLNGYVSKWTWQRKIDYCLEQSPKTTSQIVDYILELEPREKIRRNKIIGTVSAILSAKSKPGGKYGKTPNERGNNVFSIKKE